MGKNLKYNIFETNLNTLVESNIFIKTTIFGYKKNFKDILIENKLAYYKYEKSIYIKSHIDGNEYCFTNGKFNKHLIKNNLSEIDYILMCGVNLPVGYKQNFFTDGRNTKQYFIINYSEKLYKIYRSVLTSVTSDYKKLMLFYGINENEAKNIYNISHKKRSLKLSGEKNNSFGKIGLNANCYRPFFYSKNKKEDYSKFLKDKNKIYILRWASDNNIDETSYEKIKYIYYSMLFKKIHQTKGQEISNDLNIPLEQGIYLYNKEKSLQYYNSFNFLDYNKKLIEIYGTNDDKTLFNKFLIDNNYDGIMSLCLSIKNISNWGKRFYYNSDKFGKFSLRSKLEKGFVYIADKLEFINSIKFENIKIPYFNEKQKIYIIDFEIILDNNKKFLIEVKPYNQCIVPDGEILLKKEAAEEYAKKHNYIYLFITEKDLKYEYIRKKLQSY